MSDDKSAALRADISGGIIKRGRKARSSFTDDDKQRERKRAMDRKAQRVSREKTRSHIAHLEKMVEILCEKNESEATTELMAEVSRLNQEIDRLRKIIEAIKSVLRADSFECEARMEAQHNGDRSRRGSSTKRDLSTGDVDLFSANLQRQAQQAPPATHSSPPVLDNNILDDNTDNQQAQQPNPQLTDLIPTQQETFQQQQPQLGSPPAVTSPPLNFTSAWGDTAIMQRRSSIPATPPPNFFPAAKLFPTSIPPHIATPMVVSASPCKIWQKSNRVYAKMFAIKNLSPTSADAITTGTLFRAVKDGWGSLTPGEFANPTLQVLKDIDTLIFPTLDRVTRVALMHKSHLLMKYFLNSEATNFSNLPVWQRPVPSQSTTQHPIAIDFFAWPSLRARLVEQHTHYFRTSAFSKAYQRHFRFSWPFSFADTYVQRPDGELEMSELFARYHGDLRYWGVEKEFFDAFPELGCDLPVAHCWDEEERLSVSPPREEGDNGPVLGHVTEQTSSSGHKSTGSVGSARSVGSPDTGGETEMRDADSGLREGSTALSDAPSSVFDEQMEDAQQQAQAQMEHHLGQQGGDGGHQNYDHPDRYLMDLFNDLPCIA